jgi:hypothetical protein
VLKNKDDNDIIATANDKRVAQETRATMYLDHACKPSGHAHGSMSFDLGGHNMLFDKHIEPCCSYCQHGTRISDDEVVCRKRGIVPADGQCHKFVYDPFQREPERPVIVTADEDEAAAFDSMLL